MGQFTGKVVLITGANQGLGKGLALRFAAAGAALGICARNADKLKAVSDELIASGAHVLSSAMDVTEEQAVEDWVDAVHERFGRIDLLINNAGAFDGGPFEQLSLAAWDNVIGACLTGTFLCSRAAFRIIRKLRLIGTQSHPTVM